MKYLQWCGANVACLTVAALMLSSPVQAQQAASAACQSGAGTVEVTNFGAKGDGTSDNLKAFKDAAAYASRCQVPVIHVAAGTYNFVPQGPVGGILLGSNVSLNGDGPGKTVLQVAGGAQGANFDSLIWARNQDHVTIQNIGFVGNSSLVTGPGGRPLNTYGSAVSVFLDAAPSTPANGTPRNLSNFLITNCSFENFNGAAWIRVSNYNDNFTIDNVQISNNRFVSHEGNAVNPGDISFPSNAISVMGSVTSNHGLVTNVAITGNNINAAHIKGGIALWSGVRGALIKDNTISDAGADPSIPNDKGAYAITVYHNAYHYDKGDPQAKLSGGVRPDDVHIEHNVITHPRSCGIYAASPRRIYISGNNVSGQTDSQNSTLPKGGIVLNYPLDATVSNNLVSNSAIGMSLMGGDQWHISESNNSVQAPVVRPKGPPPAFLYKLIGE